jgi:hypothetical protein
VPYRPPGDGHRVTVIGKTGSGKTQAAVWLLAKRSYTRRPWIIFDYKYEELLNDIPRLEELDITKPKIPKHPGLYIVHPNASHVEDVEAFMWQIHARENIGIFIDEGYQIPTRSPAYQTLLTQGRSKRIPIIMLTQRPAWVSRFALSEAEFVQCFQLTDMEDRKRVKQFVPMPIEVDLPGPFYSWWYDNAANFKAVLQPVPSTDTILEIFHDRLVQPRRVI